MPVVLVETVGVGQKEVEVAAAADTTMVVVNPGWGDAIQANKAGLLEIADLFVINKADRPGPARPGGTSSRCWTSPSWERGARRSWRRWPRRGTGSRQLWTAIGEHRAHQIEHGTLERDATPAARTRVPPDRRGPGRRADRRHAEADHFADINAAMVAGEHRPLPSGGPVAGSRCSRDRSGP